MTEGVITLSAICFLQVDDYRMVCFWIKPAYINPCSKSIINAYVIITPDIPPNVTYLAFIYIINSIIDYAYCSLSPIAVIVSTRE